MNTEHPEDVICFVEVEAIYHHKGRIEPPKPQTLLGRLFASKTAGNFSRGGSMNWNNTILGFDIPRVDDTVTAIDGMRKEAQAALDDMAKKPNIREIVESRVDTCVWIGTRENFEPRTEFPNSPWRPRQDDMKPKLLNGEVTAQQLTDALSGFNPASARQRKAEEAERRFNEAVHHATVLQSDVPVQKPLIFKK
jgi:hypothetical protein